MVHSQFAFLISFLDPVFPVVSYSEIGKLLMLEQNQKNVILNTVLEMWSRPGIHSWLIKCNGNLFFGYIDHHSVLLFNPPVVHIGGQNCLKVIKWWSRANFCCIRNILGIGAAWLDSWTKRNIESDSFKLLVFLLIYFIFVLILGYNSDLKLW